MKAQTTGTINGKTYNATEIHGHTVAYRKEKYTDMTGRKCNKWLVCAKNEAGFLVHTTIFGGRISQAKLAEFVNSGSFNDTSGHTLVHRV